jgi:hypothetical protein
MVPRSWHKIRDKAIVRFIDERVGDYYLQSNERLAEITGLSIQDLPQISVPVSEASESVA